MKLYYFYIMSNNLITYKFIEGKWWRKKCQSSFWCTLILAKYLIKILKPEKSYTNCLVKYFVLILSKKAVCPMICEVNHNPISADFRNQIPDDYHVKFVSFSLTFVSFYLLVKKEFV